MNLYNYQNTLCNYWSKWIIRLKLIWCKGSQLIEKEIYELTGLIEFVQDRPGHDFRYSLNSDKISEKLRWKKKSSFEKGIEDTVLWYIDNIEWANSKLKNITQIQR